MMETGRERERLLESVMARHHYAGDALIEILHVAQQVYGYLSAPLLKEIARKLRLPPSKVLGVATFYHLFRFTPPPERSGEGAGRAPASPSRRGKPSLWDAAAGPKVPRAGAAARALVVRVLRQDGEKMGRSASAPS